MGRWCQPRFLLPFVAALGLSGCLLFSDPVNKAPTVSITSDSSVIYRGQDVVFTATVSDDHDPLLLIQLRWSTLAAKGGSCLGITAADWPRDSSSVSADRTYAPSTLTTGTCVCAQATDTHGASGYACYGPINPITPTPRAVITDESGLLSGASRPLCSQIRLSAESSVYPDGDPITLVWDLQSSSSDPLAKNVQLAKCDNVVGNSDAHRCLYASVPGTFTVSLTIKDSFDPKAPVGSDPVQFVVHVATDAPPCLRLSDPDVYAKLTFLSGSSGGNGVTTTYQSRTFKALTVADDCEPYPMVSGSTGQTQFVWSVYDPTNASTGSPGWVLQADTSESFTISQAQFPNARPGDAIKVRLEVRDTAVQQIYRAGGSACSDKTLDICCGPNGCTGTNDCVRWTTWTVQFQP